MTTPIVYVGGSGRSGSTLLERLLARIPGVWPVGELAFVWERGLQRNDCCGCGERFRDCEFWHRVGQAGFGGWDRVDVREAARLRASVDRHRNLGRLSGMRRPGKLGPAMSAYAELAEGLYRGVRDASGASVLVDSSKHASYALFLTRLRDFDVRLVHLVRRSHGVAHSWSKRVRKPGVGDGTSYMSVHPAAWAVRFWIVDNLVLDAVGHRMPLATRLRYEDLIARPQAELRRVAADLELPVSGQEFSFVTGSAAELPVSHALSGNPMAFQHGRIALKVDDEWRTAMSRPRRVLVSAATWPLLLHYGYPISAGLRR